MRELHERIHLRKIFKGESALPLYALESACVKIVWQREFQLQEVKVRGLEVLGGNSPVNSNTLSRGKTKVFKYKR
jgi:hypothetical protein